MNLHNKEKRSKSVHVLLDCMFLASQDALEVMLFTYFLLDLLMVSIDFTDVTMVSHDI